MIKKIIPATMALFALNGAMAQKKAHYENVKLGCKNGEPTDIVWQADDIRFNETGDIIKHKKTTINYNFSDSTGVILEQKKGADYCDEQPYTVTKPAEKFIAAVKSTCALYKNGRDIDHTEQAEKGTTEYCLAKPFRQLAVYSNGKKMMIR